MRLKTYRYSVTKGVQNVKTKTALILSAVALAVTGTGGLTYAVVGVTHAATQSNVTTYTALPYNTTDWTADRTFPSGGVTVDSYGGRTGTLNIGIDSGNRSTVDPFYYTEGIKHSLNSAAAVRADLYVDGSWASSKTPVRAGLWGVGQDSTGAISAYPIIEYTTRGDNGYVGWRTFNDELGGWTNLPNVTVNTDGWNTVNIVYNTTTSLFDFYINGQAAGSSVATGSTSLSAVILNSYNYGTDGQSYNVHWSNVASGSLVGGKDACKNGGWVNQTALNGASFKNQGACVSYLASNGKSQH